jgi:hypothetical protein
MNIVPARVVVGSTEFLGKGWVISYVECEREALLVPLKGIRAGNDGCELVDVFACVNQKF